MGVLSVTPEVGLSHLPVAYTGKDNPIELILKDGTEELDFSAATVIRAAFDEIIVDSSVDAEAFELKNASTGRLSICIGNQSIPPKAYNLRVEIEIGGKTLYFGHVRVVVKDPGIA
jgi:hypothetical protein